MMKSEILTKSDVQKIKEEIEHRKLVIRPKALEDVKTARAQGDLSENFEYYAAKKFNRENNSRIDYLEKMLKYATIVDEEELNNNSVQLNSLVKIKFVDESEDEEDWEVEEYKIVTSIRGNSLENKISIESPLGKSLVGKNVNEIVSVKLENGTSYEVKIISIEYSSSVDDNIKSF